MADKFFSTPKRKCCKIVLEMEASTTPADADLHQCRSCGAMFMYNAEKKKWQKFPSSKELAKAALEQK